MVFQGRERGILCVVLILIFSPSFYLYRNSFNWWIGLFYGVLPSSFACGHSINHHKYNNGPLDVVSTSDKVSFDPSFILSSFPSLPSPPSSNSPSQPRDNFSNFVRFLPRWTLYATNVSTIRQFIFQKEYKVAWRMFVGTVFYMIWIGCFWRLSPIFTFWFVFIFFLYFCPYWVPCPKKPSFLSFCLPSLLPQ